MSFATWIEEFYPVPADDCPREQALEHSILKWTGLLPENLEKHGVQKCASYVQDPKGILWLRLDASSCALCAHHWRQKWGCKDIEDPCPIMRVTGNTCDARYLEFITSGQATPMLDLLRQVKEALDAPQA